MASYVGHTNDIREKYDWSISHNILSYYMTTKRDYVGYSFLMLLRNSISREARVCRMNYHFGVTVCWKPLIITERVSQANYNNHCFFYQNELVRGIYMSSEASTKRPTQQLRLHEPFILPPIAYILTHLVSPIVSVYLIGKVSTLWCKSFILPCRCIYFFFHRLNICFI